MIKVSKSAARLALGVFLGGMASSVALAQSEPVTMGVVTFFSGPAAASTGLPGRNGAELIIEAINSGSLPAPYNSVGLAGRKIDPAYLDEAGGNAKAITETRNLIQRRGAQVLVGYTGSGTCLAVTPVVEELKVLTLFANCGTPRIFEEEKRNYVFRTMGHTVSDGVAAARYLADVSKDLKKVTGINQNYSFGTDAWAEFTASTSALIPNLAISDKPQWPKFLAGQYSTELSALMLDDSSLVYSSFWGGDLEALILQGAARGLFERKQVMLSMGADAYDRLGKQVPDGVIVGGRGPYGLLVRDRDTVLNRWFIKSYREKYGHEPNSASYFFAQGVLAAKVGYDRAMEKHKAFPTTDQVVETMRGMEFESFSTTVKFALGNGHQAVTENGYGMTSFDAKENRPALKNVKFYPPACLFPPDGTASQEWLKSGVKDAKC